MRDEHSTLTVDQATALLPDGETLRIFSPEFQESDPVQRDLVMKGLNQARRIYTASNHDKRQGYGILLDFDGGLLESSTRLFLVQTRQKVAA